MTDENTTAISAIQFVLMAVIASHPDKKALLQQFDKLSSEHQIAAISMGGGLPSELRTALDAYRAQIAAFP